jgi:acyl-CoA thioester hydrolase
MTEPPNGTRYRYHCPMRWSDMDAYGHVNNVMFLTYLEEARVDMLLTLGTDSGAKALASGVLVSHHEIDYHRPLVYHPGGVDIHLWCSAIKGATFDMRYEVRDESTLFATAASTLVCFDLAAQRPRRVSAEERVFLARYYEPPT